MIRSSARSGSCSTRAAPGSSCPAPTPTPRSGRRPTPTGPRGRAPTWRRGPSAVCGGVTGRIRPSTRSSSRMTRCYSTCSPSGCPTRRYGAASWWRTRRRSTTIRRAHRVARLSLQPHVVERRRPGIGIDQHDAGLRHPRPDPARPDVLEDGPHAYALVDEPLDLVEQGLPLGPVRLAALLLVEGVQV